MIPQNMQTGESTAEKLIYQLDEANIQTFASRQSKQTGEDFSEDKLRI